MLISPVIPIVLRKFNCLLIMGLVSFLEEGYLTKLLTKFFIFEKIRNFCRSFICCIFLELQKQV
jgi:hypothetical protein